MKHLALLILNCEPKYNGHNQIELTGVNISISDVMLLVEELEKTLDIVHLRLYNDVSGTFTGNLYDEERLLIGFEKIIL
jgi:hypothetical protein